MVSARTALLVALRDGPGYGRELARRIRTASGGRTRLGEASIYPALRELRAARLVNSWEVVPGRTRGGRSRTYYELTERGARAASDVRAALLGLAGTAPAAPGSEAGRSMRRRIDLGVELSEAALALAIRRPLRRGPRSE
jgi:DNA-binding PadR family transcriptional regulator